MTWFEIRSVRELPVDELGPLLEAARVDDFRALDRLVSEWRAGTNRFEAAGEALFVARAAGVLIGIGGLNRDPHSPSGDAGRVRRLYVLPEQRRLGAGRALVEAVEAHARERASGFGRLVLRTHDPHAAAFYAALGFDACDAETHTHEKRLRDPRTPSSVK